MQMKKRGNQREYNIILNAFDGKNKGFQECVYHLIGLGYLYSQAKNAVYVYFQGGDTYATSILTREIRDELLDKFYATSKTHKQCVDYIMNHGYTYHQSNTASYQYRKERGLIAKKESHLDL
jgi:hypothetical protein